VCQGVRLLTALIRPLPNHRNLLSYEGATSCASSNEEGSSLISVSKQLQAIRRNGQCTIELVESLVELVTKLTKEVTHLKSDNMILKQEIKNLHSFLEASPRPHSQHIRREQCILPEEMSCKEAASNQPVPSADLHTQALPAVSIPAGTTLSYRDVAAAGISPSGPTAPPDPDGFKPLCTERRPPPALPLLTLLLLPTLNLADSPLSVLAARYPCLLS
jgi:hypothetical protein